MKYNQLEYTCIVKKRANGQRVERLEIVKGDLFFLRKNGKQKVKIITNPKDQKHVLEA